mmetsp:Transcript_28261/g.42787  ORF Transcript_28261/g.42787 Transcript_28261/m.42787 type:complete len:186 (+) Transcript_28261:310-867(+)
MHHIEVAEDEYVTIFEEATQESYREYIMSILSEGSQFKKLNFFKSMLLNIQNRAGKDITQDLKDLTPEMLNMTYEEMMELCEKIAANKDQDWSHLIPVTEYYCPMCGGCNCDCHDMMKRKEEKAKGASFELNCSKKALKMKKFNPDNMFATPGKRRGGPLSNKSLGMRSLRNSYYHQKSTDFSFP